MTRGMVLGKFMPPHAGHLYLCEFAKNWVEDLTIVVGTLAAEPIPGELRHRWMRELFPADTVLHLTDENPQDPSEHPDFWNIWQASLERILPERPDLVFASEPYGAKLAEVLGAEFVPVDLPRATIPVSGTAIRTDPIRHWEFIPRCVRPHFVRRVSIIGPESTGKTTLARTLADTFGTVWVPEWARTVLEHRNGSLDDLNWPNLVRGQIASEEALARNADRVLFCDTEPLLTTVWAESLLGACPPEVTAAAAGRTYDLTLLTEPDVPWVADQVRYLPGESEVFLDRCRTALTRAGRTAVPLRGDWTARTEQAVGHVRALLQQTNCPVP
ncbi:AAA family ATPase [Nocardia sp. NPDC005978]|uniref:AAA family ATPase n=1 Tax=Nocardia sp. NPDC005978 TaxID=3156725 RepID=UPI0033A1C559